MAKTAILVDGGFFRKRASFLWEEHSPDETATAKKVTQTIGIIKGDLNKKGGVQWKLMQ